MAMGKNGNQFSSSLNLAEKRAKLRRMLLESLERRELMAADGAAVFAPGTSLDYINQIGDQLGSRRGSGSGGNSANFETGTLRWSNPTGGVSPSLGDPSIVSWSIVPDGTLMNDINGTAQPSNFIAFMDGIYGGGSGPISSRPWFPLIQRAYTQWATISGLTFQYEPNDDGAPQGAAARGVTGVRGDSRIGGNRIDGDSGILAFANFPSQGGNAGFDGDIIFDTADGSYRASADAPTGENRFLVNTAAHEIGHAIGIFHSDPINDTKLMEPVLSTRFLGPQHDDTLAVQTLYGDDFENNDTALTATNLGTIPNGIRQFPGLSMDANIDRDFFALDAPSSGKLSITITPIGFQYITGPQGGATRAVDTLRNSDLSFQLLGSDGSTILAQVNGTAIGSAETLVDFDIRDAGRFFIRVDGAQDAIQLFDMSISGSGFRSTVNTDVRPPQLISVNPNAGSILNFTGTNVLSVSPTELIFRFDGAQRLDANTLSSIRITRAGHDGTFNSGNEVVIQPGYLGFGDTERIVIARFKNPLPNDKYRVEVFAFDDPDRNIIGLRNVDGLLLQPRVAGTDRDTVEFSLELGAQIVSIVPQPITRVGNALQQQLNQIEVYFNEDDLNVASATNISFYQLILTGDTIRNIDDQSTNPTSVTYDAATNKAVLTFSGPLHQLFGAASNGGTYRLRIGTNEAQPAVPVPVNPVADPGDSFGTSTALPAFNGLTSLSINSTITNTTDYDLDFPGAPDTPGDREIESVDHFSSDAPDTTSGIAVQFYNFMKTKAYGTNSQGQLLFSTITPAQEQRVREVFSFYSQYLGIRFVETDDDQGGASWTIAVGDLAPLGDTSQPGQTLATSGFALPLTNNHTFGRNVVIMDSAETWNDAFGASDNVKPSFFTVAMREIGNLLGLGDPSELPPGTILSEIYTNPTLGGEALLAGNNPLEPVFPGDHDIVHGRYLFRPDGKDVDLYSFDIPANSDGVFTVEVVAERQKDGSLLDSYLTLYRETTNPDGSKSREVIAVNDDYFSKDSLIQVPLSGGTAGTRYYIGVSASGNNRYNPEIRDSGLGGTSEGGYELRTTFRPLANASIVDTSGTPIDGDADGKAGGVHNFWFRAAAPHTGAATTPRTLFVDKSWVPVAGVQGTLANPFNNIATAFQAAQPGDIVRIVGNNGIDNNGATLGDNFAYEIGRGGILNQPLQDGQTMNVPRGVTVMIDAGAIFKLRGASINVGSTTSSVDRSRGNLQVLGTPTRQVIFSSYNEKGLGIDTNSLPTTPNSGDWGGIEFKNDIDRAEGRPDREREGVFLNYINNADIRFGGGQISLDSQTRVITPIQMTQSRPTLSFNKITSSADAAISADPDSFEESTFTTPVFQLDGTFTPDYSRIGPEIHGNQLSRNTTNGLFVRIDTLAGNKLTEQTVAGRWDDTDIVHVVGQNLLLKGNPGGPKMETAAPAINLVTLTPLTTTTGTLAAGQYNYRVVYVDAVGGESIPSNATQNVTVAAAQNSVQLANLPAATTGFVSRRVYRSQVGGAGPYSLVAEINRSDAVFVDRGTTRPNQLAITTQLNRARLDSSLVIDPGMIVKLEGARIEAGIGSTLIAEGTDGIPVIFTSRRDDRYGASGEFDTNNDGATSANSGNWGGLVFSHLSKGSLDHALVTFAGGQTSVAGSFAGFNATEIHQADVRITNTVYESNASGFGGLSSANRDGRGFNEPAIIFVRGSQPILIDNIIRDNISANTPAISINANALNAESNLDDGRSRGFADRLTRIVDNVGPLVIGNFLGENAINGMVVRGQTLTTATIWDDTDIVHVVQDEIIVPDLHVYGGLKLKSRPTESLVVKLSTNAGFTATGRPLDIEDRIGGIVQIVGSPGFPVILTSLRDDSVGSGFDPNGQAQTDTNGDGPSAGIPGDWRSIRLDQYSHDRNVESVIEQESPQVTAPGTNSIPANAQQIGFLSPTEKAGDDNRRLGFTIQGVINERADVDVYSFSAEAGTEVWFDIDRSTNGLDTVVELIDGNGQIIAQSDNSFDEANGVFQLFLDPNAIAFNRVNSLPRNPFFPKNGDGSFTDFYSTNPFDAGFRIVLPGTTGEPNNYFVRVRSSNIDSLDPTANRADLQDSTLLLTGKSTGRYELQIRLRELDETAGSTVRYADVRFATVGVEVLGMPIHSPLLGEAAEPGPVNGIEANDNALTGTALGNLVNSDRGTLSVAGQIRNNTDVDWYQFDINQDSIQGSGLAQHISSIIDVDYADSNGRPNTNIWLFYDFRRGSLANPTPQLRLVAASNDSNIADDRPAPLTGSNLNDLSRGSIGFLDAYLGSTELASGRYFLAITNNTQMPVDYRQWQEPAPANSLARVEPVNSIVKIAEDRFNLSPPPATTAAGPITVAFDPNESPVDYTLSDVTLFVTRPDAGTQSILVTVDPMSGAAETRISRFPTVNDIAMRPDGTLYGYAIPQGLQTDANSGNYLRIDTAGDGTTTTQGNSGIQTFELDPATNPPNARQALNAGATQGHGMQFTGITFTRTGGNLDLYGVGQRGNGNASYFTTSPPPPNFPNPVNARNFVYNLNPATGVVINDPQIERTDAARATGAGTQSRERGQIDTTVDNSTQPSQVLYTSPALSNAGNIIDGDIITVSGQTFEFDTVLNDPSILLNIIQSGQAPRDGQTFSLTVGATNFVFEFDTGRVLLVNTNAIATLESDIFTLTDDVGTPFIFEFSADANLATTGAIRIPYGATDPVTTLINSIVATVNGVGASFQAVTVAGTGRVSFIGDTGLALGALNDSGILGQFGNYGVAAANTQILVEEFFGNAEVGAAIAGVLDGTHPSGVTAAVTGNQVTFVGADRGNFTGISWIIIQSSGGGVQNGRVAIPFSTGDNAEEIAQSVFNSISSVFAGLTWTGNSVSLPSGLFYDTARTHFQRSAVNLSGPLMLDATPPRNLQATNQPIVNGLAMIGSRMYAVSERGDLFEVGSLNPFTGVTGAFNPVSTANVSDYIATILDPETGLPVNFSGLTAGPRNVEGGKFLNVLFGIASDGDVYAFDTRGRLVPAFANGASKLSTGVGGANGLAFSTLDVNLWHLSDNQAGQAGHGSAAPFDGSRGAIAGGESMYFGFVNPTRALTQPGNWTGIHDPGNTAVEATYDPARYNTYDLPGGAHGSMESNPLDLRNYSKEDKPTLYFNYFLATENSNSDLNDGDFMRDSLRVFVAGENGAWQLLATNNSEFDNERVTNSADEKDYFLTGSETQVQELYDVNDTVGGSRTAATNSWRQARLDLGDFAGQENVRIRIDFATAGEMALGVLGTGGEELRAVAGHRLVDGSTFTIAGVTFEFDMGATISAPTGANITEGSTFIINGVPYRFTATPTLATDIAFAANDDAATMAGRIANALLAQGEAVNINPRNAEKIGISSATSASVGAGLPANFLDGTPGFGGGNEIVSVTYDMSDIQVRDAVRVALARAFNTLSQRDNIDTFRVDGPIIKLLTQRVTDPGLLGLSRQSGNLNSNVRLPGDQFGAFEQGIDAATAFRGQRNRFEGVYIDDVVVGFAERGEIVTGGLLNNTNFADNLQYEVQSLAGPAKDEVEVGSYQVEIRRAASFGITTGAASLSLNPLLGARSFDTNDRLLQGYALVSRTGAEIADGQRFTLSDGVDTVTFEFNDTALTPASSGFGFTQGNIEIPYNVSMTSTQVAAAIRNAINSNEAQASLNIIAGLSDSRDTGFASSSVFINLYGVVAADNAGTLNFGDISFVEFGTDNFAMEDWGDENLFRDQGQVILNGNVVRDSSSFGIVIDAGARSRNDLVPLAGALPHAGPVRNLSQLNAESWTPGVVATNNILAQNRSGGIQFSGDARTPGTQSGSIPFGRLVNNTIFGLGSGDIGIRVTDNASPTILNNIVASTGTGISLDATSQTTVIGTTLYQSNGANVAGTPTLGAFPLILAPTDPLFAAASSYNFYPRAGSRAIDSSLDSLDDRPALVTVRTPMGIPQSPILAPNTDISGQLRVDDPAVSTPAGQGANVFKDRGAYDRADFVGPVAQLLIAQDNDSERKDIDPNQTYVQLTEGVLDHFSLLLLEDNGTGPDISTITNTSVTVIEDGRLLVEGVDYTFGFSATNRTIRLTPLSGIWRPGSAYEITLNNRDRFVLTAQNGAGVTDGEQFRIIDRNGVAASFEFESGYSVSVPQTLTLVVPALGAGTGGIVDGQTFRIAFNTTQVNFELDSNNNIVNGNVRVPFTVGDTATQVRDKILAVIAAQTTLNLAPKAVGTDKIHLGSVAGHSLDISNSKLIPEGIASGVTDGQTFTFTQDGTPTTFEFNLVGDTTFNAANRQISFLRSDTHEEIAVKLTTAVQAAPLDLPLTRHLGNGLVHLGGRFGQLLDVSGSALIQAGSPNVTKSIELLVPVTTGPGAIQDGETFRIRRGTQTVVFEFNTNAATTPGNTIINFSPTDSADVVAQAIANVVAGSPLGLTPTALPGGIVRLNETIEYVVDTTSTRMTQSGVAGGAIPIVYVPTSQFSATEMAGVIINAINGTIFAVDARSRGSASIFLDGVSLVTGITSSEVQGIKDIAGNSLQANRSNRETQFTILLPGVQLDYGDAIDPAYPTVLNTNGARHVVLPNNPLRLGSLVSVDTNGQPSAGANTDVNDDGVTFTGIFNENSVPVVIDVTASGSGLLNAWVDWNRDGDWSDPGEQIFTDQPVKIGTNTFQLQTPAGASPGVSYTRFRLNSAGGLDPRGVGMDGEVEDYRIDILPGAPPVGTTDSYVVFEDPTTQTPILTSLAPNDPLNLLTPGIFNDNGMLANDTDPQSQTLSAILVSGPANAATFTFNANGTFTYVPAANFVGVDRFVYRVASSSGLVANTFSTVAINVVARNDAPTIGTPNPKTFVGAESTPLVLTNAQVMAGDSAGPTHETDAVPTGEGQTIAITSITNITPAGSTVSITPTGLVFTPPANYIGAASFNYTITDNGRSGTLNDNAAGSLVDDFKTATGTVSINVISVNDPPSFTPIAPGPNVTVLEDSGAYSQAWATNITAGPGEDGSQTVDFIVTTDHPEFFDVPPAISRTGVLTFTPRLNANGTAVVTVILRDSESNVAPNRNESTPLLFNLQITPQNDVPVAANISRTITEDATLTLTQPVVLATAADPDLPNDVLTVVWGSTTSARGATITINPDGSSTYNPRNVAAIQALLPGQQLVDTYTYTIRDSAPSTSNVATVTVTLTGVNDAPNAVNDAFTVGINTPQRLAILANDSDVDSAINIGSVSIEDLPSFGTLIVNNDGTVTYQSAGTFRGTDTFTYRVRDVQGLASNLATVNVLVNEAPVAVNDQVFTVRNTPIDITVLANDRDPDGTLVPTSVTVVTPPTVAQGTATPLANGLIRFTPANGFVGAASFTYNVRDNAGTVSNTATVTIQVLASNYQNPSNRLDVNADGFISPIDALIVINDLNIRGPRPLPPGLFVPPPFIDVNGDGEVGPIDALLVIQYLNTISDSGNSEGPEGEGEDALAAMSASMMSTNVVSMVSAEDMINVVGRSVAREARNQLDSALFSGATRRAATVPAAMSYSNGSLSSMVDDESTLDALLAGWTGSADDEEEATDLLFSDLDGLI